MSRIEEALEKASQLRRREVPSRSTSLSLSCPAPHLPPPLPESERLKVTNQLLVAANDPHAPVAEEYRKLKTILVQLTKGDQFQNMLMVTSSVSNEGKSITSLNLAMTLAEEYDHTVLLVDADLRKPSIHHYLDIRPTIGLAECLLDGASLGDAIIRTGIGKLSLLPAGRVVNNPAEIFSSQKVRELFLEMKHRYRDRYIIIDTPPVLPFADTRSMAGIIDGVVVVVKEGVVQLDNVSETLECLKETNVLGIVYNQATLEGDNDRYRYYRHTYS